jgi:sugar phosphate isomerase/epimerase
MTSMLSIGIFTRTFVRPTLGQTLDAVVAHGLSQVQFGLIDTESPHLPDQVDPAALAVIRTEFAAHRITLTALSGTYNMIHPDAARRADGLRRLRVLAAACAPLDTRLITLCTGTRDPDNMWRRHPANDAPDAWRDLQQVMQAALTIAEEYDVTLGIEPEPANVVDRPAKARRLLDEMRSPRLKIVMDGANLFHAGDLARMPQILDEAFALLGGDIALAHAKDLAQDGEAGHIAAGTGRLDYNRYLALLQRAGYDGPLMLHSLDEAQVAASVAFLRAKLAGLGAA